MSSKRETEFLDELVREAEHKVARQKEALNAAAGSLETDGQQQLLHNAEMERDLLRDLLKQQAGSDAVSLDALIMQRANRLHERAAALAGHWKRGQATPPEYWDLENQRHFLLDVLRRFHAAQAASTLAPVPAPSTPAHPWFNGDPSPATGGANRAANPDEIHDQIIEALATAGYPAKHLEIMVQPQGLVVVTGHAHSAEDREHALTAIMSV